MPPVDDSHDGDSPDGVPSLADLDLLARGQAERTIRRLTAEYGTTFALAEVADVYLDSYRSLARTATVTTFLPVLAERFTRDRLLARAADRGQLARRVPHVLFVCVHNAGRSQMAAAFARHFAAGEVRVSTGGSDPGSRVHPEVAAAMKDVGLSLDQEFPKPLTDDVLGAADVVVTMGCGDECPYVPGKRYEDWPIADPANAAPADVEAIRDDVAARVRGLLTSLLPDLELPPTAASP